VAQDTDAVRYLIEVKTRTDDETVREELLATGFAYRISPVGWSNRVATILHDAAVQLRASTEASAIRLVWICLRSKRESNEMFSEQIRHTLYGIARVAGSGRGASAPPCYYFHESVFFRHRDLAGVVLDIGHGGALCLNDHSPRANELRTSKLGRSFRDAVWDPPAREAAGLCLIADTKVSRKFPERVLQYVSEKYGISNAVHFNLDEHAGFTSVPRER
jgi:hypothetical protein